MKVLVGTLACGENELPRCKQALAEQRGGFEIDQFELHDLPNQEAHARLYQEFNRRAKDYGLLLKLDADMVLRHDRALIELVELFGREAELDHAQLAVQDWFSDAPLMGLHAFSSRARWPECDREELFVDPYPVIPGRRLDLWGAPAPLADHAPDPSPLQAFQFGVHRALKVVQRGRERRRYDAPRAWHQFRFLQRTWQHFERCGDPRLGLAVMGADLVLQGELKIDRIEHKADELRGLFSWFEELNAMQIRERLSPRWQRPRFSAARHWFSVRKRALLAKLPGR